jgi:hypothetical protein
MSTRVNLSLLLDIDALVVTILIFGELVVSDSWAC